MPRERIQQQVDQLLGEAEQAVAREDWAVVAARARAALRLDETNEDAQGYLDAANRPAGTEAIEEKQPIASSPPPARLQDSFISGKQGFALLGFAGTLIGSFLPWIEESVFTRGSNFLPGSTSIVETNGTDIEGIYTALLAGVGVFSVLGARTEGWAWLAVIAGGASSVLAILVLNDMSEAPGKDVLPGLVITAVSSVIATVASFSIVSPGKPGAESSSSPPR